MIRKLLDLLSQTDLELEAEDIADALWLAAHIDQTAASPDNIAIQNEQEQESRDENPSISVHTEHQETSKIESRPVERPTTSQLFLPTPQGKKAMGGMAFRSPTAPALPGALNIARALRPFRQGMPSTHQFILDEDATAERIAEIDLWIPVQKPALAPRFEVALVVDESVSMVVWRQTIAELRFLLEHHSGFRDVRTWSLLTDAEDGKLDLLAGTHFTTQKRQRHSPLELVSSKSHRLILVVTDCVSTGWRKGEVSRILALWGEKTPVAIVQVLPQRLWSRTALGIAASVRLKTISPEAIQNTRLSAKIGSRWLEGSTLPGLPMPIITLEASAFSAWARMLTGATAATMPGFLLPKADEQTDKKYPWPTGIQADVLSEKPLTAEDRLQQFQRTASPTARKLARHLAVVPISLPVIRLIQYTMVPEARQGHIAEFFLGGLLEETPSEAGSTRPDDVQYEFIAGVRDILLNSVSISETLQVLSQVSEYIEDRFGQFLDFAALLAHPKGTAELHMNEKSKPFAIIAAQVLRRFGGKYTQLAQELEIITSEENVQLKPSQESEAEPEKPPIIPSQIPRRPATSIGLRSSIYIKRRCPSCFNEFYPGDCRILSGRTSGKVLKATPTGLQQQLARINPEPLSGQFYTLELAYRECPHCQYALPHNIERVENITIAIVGDVFSGKSTYLATLLYNIRHLLTNNNFHSLSLTPDREQMFRDELLESLFTNHRVLEPTRPGISPYQHPLIWELNISASPNHPTRNINLLFYENAGEDYESDRLVSFARHIFYADGIIFLIDPLSIPAIFHRLPHHLRPHSNYLTGRSPGDTIYSVINLIKQYRKLDPHSHLSSIPIALTLTKSDILPYINPHVIPIGSSPLKEDYSSPEIFRNQPDYTNRIDLQDTSMVDQEVRTFLKNFGEYPLLALARTVAYVNFFAVSATGSSPDAQGHYPFVKPIRCLDPFLWCLYELGIIEAKK